MLHKDGPGRSTSLNLQSLEQHISMERVCLGQELGLGTHFGRHGNVSNLEFFLWVLVWMTFLEGLMQCPGPELVIISPWSASM